MSSKSHFFNKGLRLLADYQFNNNLIDDANGYNLSGTEITYNNGSAVFNSSLQSKAIRNDSNSIFSFTDGTNDLPFRIETSFKLKESLNQFEFILNKRGGATVNAEYNLVIDYNSNLFNFSLFNGGSNTSSISITIPFLPSTTTIYNIIITYGGSGLDGLNMVLNGVNATNKTETGNYVNMIQTGSPFEISKSPFGNNLNAEIDYLKIYK